MNLENSKFFKNYGYAVIVSGVVFLGALLSWFLIISPLYANTQQSKVQLDAKNQEYTALKDKKSKLDQLKSQETELKAQATLVSNALPKDEEIGRLFIQLDALAKASNGTLRSVTKTIATATAAPTSTASLDSAGISKTVYSLPLELPTYFDLKTFIASSQSALRLFSINDFNISASNAGALTINLTANSYTRK
jgi:Tfp pilus assembly protein PilO